MKTATVLLACAAMLAFASPAAADGKRITTEAEFRQLVVDRDLDGGELRIRSDAGGKLEGTSRGRSFSGTWKWVDDTYCRQVFSRGQDLGYDCQAVFVDGDTVTFIRKKGKGQKVKLRIGSK